MIQDLTYDFLSDKKWPTKALKNYLSYNIRRDMNRIKSFMGFYKDSPDLEIQKKIKGCEEYLPYLVKAEAIFVKRIKDLEALDKEKDDGQKIKKALLDKCDGLKALEKMGKLEVLYNFKKID